MAVSERQPPVNRNGWLAFGLAGLVVVLDQAAKAWLLGTLHLRTLGTVPVLPFFKLSYVENKGVAFGFLTAPNDLGRWFLVGFAACVIVALGLWARRLDRRLTAVAVGLIMGGAAGNNVVDRVFSHHVFDYLDFSALYFPWVFNIADSAISVGVALLVLESLLTPKPATS